MSKTVRLRDSEVVPLFMTWATVQRKSGVRLICMEGLSCAGKSWLRKHFLNKNFRSVELDSFLPKPAQHTTSWIEQVNAIDAVQFIRSALGECDCVFVEGPVVWPVVTPVVQDLGRSVVRRVYLKRVLNRGGVVYWDAGEGLLELAETRAQYPKSILEYHGNNRPWCSADLIIERMEEE